MNAPDPQRLGGLAWVRRTGGQLSRTERRGLFVAIAVGQWQNAVGRAKLVLGRLPAAAARVDLDAFRLPDSKFARESEEACAELPPTLQGHSYRTWLFGRALATVDGHEMDDELFYCGALLHDYGIVTPTANRDFTLGSVERMLSCADAAGLDEERADLLADGICVHTTPGVNVDIDGTIGCYLQWGAMVDGAGLRMWDIAPHDVEEVLRRYPRGDFKRELIAMMSRQRGRKQPILLLGDVLAQLKDRLAQPVPIARIRQVDRLEQRLQLPVLAHQYSDVLGEQVI